MRYERTIQNSPLAYKRHDALPTIWQKVCQGLIIRKYEKGEIVQEQTQINIIILLFGISMLMAIKKVFVDDINFTTDESLLEDYEYSDAIFF